MSAALLASSSVSARGLVRTVLLGLVGSLGDGRFTPHDELLLVGRLQEALVFASLPADGVRAFAAGCVHALSREGDTQADRLVRENVARHKLPWLLGKPMGPGVVAAGGTPATRKAAARAVESMLARGRRPPGTTTHASCPAPKTETSPARTSNATPSLTRMKIVPASTYWT